MVSAPGFESWPGHISAAQFLPTEVHTMGLTLHRPVDPTCPSGRALAGTQEGECWTIVKVSTPLSITNWF
jgi:hypothetical protein